MKWTIPVVALVVGCAAPEQDNRICLDWDSRVVIREKCIPMYGTLICSEQEKTEMWCVLYEELEPMRKDDA